MFTIYASADDAVVKYARSLAVEAQEEAWTQVQRDA